MSLMAMTEEPTANFIIVQFGDNEQFIMNVNCCQVNFMNYLRKKCQYDKRAIIDLMDEEEGNLAMVHTMGHDENVRGNFVDRMNYVPVLLEKAEEDGTVKKVKPLLTDWEKRYPQLEKRIKIMTGEIKKGRKSPTRGKLEVKGLDRRSSKTDKSSLSIGRSSISQAGKFSSAKLSSASVAAKGSGKTSKSDRKGSKGTKGKKK